MGRGRAKAKQTKVARELKYTTTGTDLDRLRAELAADSTRVASPEEAAALAEDDLLEDDEDEDDPAAPWTATS
ncbi:MAG TPA: DUF3073 domain-containing protein [Mycobacteriales bacterium]|nr:DUF3073 domain-containing protein [Mycobacteriales bacterium]